MHECTDACTNGYMGGWRMDGWADEQMEDNE
jgi:hypothetical protein